MNNPKPEIQNPKLEILSADFADSTDSNLRNQRKLRIGFGALGRRRASLAVAAVLVCLAGGAVYLYLSPHIWAWYHWWSAGRAARNHELTATVEHLQSCLQIWPHSADVHFLLGRTYRRQDKIVIAREHLQKANVLRYNADDLRLEFHLLEVQVGAVRAVMPKIEEFLAKGHPDELLIYEALSKGLTRLNYAEEAYHYATRWVQRAPNDWYAYYNRGVVYERGQFFRNAKDDFEHALELKPDDLNARLHLADILSNKKEIELALTQYEIGFRYHPESAFLAIGMARCLVRMGREAEARTVLEPFLNQPGADSKKDLAEGFLLLGDMEWHLEQPAKALVQLRKAAALASANPHVNRRLGRFLRALGQTAEAQHYEDKAELADKTFMRLDQIIAELRASGPPSSDAAKAHSADLRWEAGTSLLRIGQEEDGISWLVSAAQLDPSHEKTKQTLKEFYADKAPLLERSKP